VVKVSYLGQIDISQNEIMPAPHRSALYTNTVVKNGVESVSSKDKAQVEAINIFSDFTAAKRVARVLAYSDVGFDSAYVLGGECRWCLV
jgi:hypothetical protein